MDLVGDNVASRFANVAIILYIGLGIFSTQTFAFTVATFAGSTQVLTLSSSDSLSTLVDAAAQAVQWLPLVIANSYADRIWIVRLHRAHEAYPTHTSSREQQAVPGFVFVAMMVGYQFYSTFSTIQVLAALQLFLPFGLLFLIANLAGVAVVGVWLYLVVMALRRRSFYLAQDKEAAQAVHVRALLDPSHAHSKRDAVQAEYRARHEVRLAEAALPTERARLTAKLLRKLKASALPQC